MAVLIALLVGIFCLALIVAPIIYLHSRKILREQKNFERGLKMVPLLIHLPPPSDDTDAGNRDIRDVTDENISKAQTLYSIIASTFEKNFKRKFYGQRHISFEIVAHDGFVKFYAVVPIGLIDVVKQAVVSAYPTAQMEEVNDHNIFSKVGRISGTLGGELTLKENFAYPIATYQDIKRDPMQSVLNALSTLDKQDGAAIQILLRPAKDGWAKEAHELAKKKREGKDKKKFKITNIGSYFPQVFKALSEPPEDKSSSSSGPPGSNLSSHQQSIIDSIDDKTRYPGFEVSIRVITSSNLAQRSQSILSNVVASFALYDAQGKNGFKYSVAQDIESFATAYIMRFFPQHHTSNILNSVELATLFHFPQQEDIPTSQLTRQDSKQVDGPRNIPDDGLLLGYNVFRGVKKPIRLALEDRRRHIYAVGQTGTGKSTFLENLALQDMLMGNGFAFIDPHGDTAEKLLSMVPKERTEDVIYFSPADTDYPLGLNIFEAETDDEKDFVIQEVINVLYKLYDPQRQGIIGPRYEHLFRNAALTVMSGPDGGSFVDIPKLFRDKEYVKQKLKYVKDQNVLDFWQKEMVQAQRSNEFGDVVNWFVSKFGAFLSNAMMRNIIGQTKSSFDMRDIMDNKKILLVNLSKGRTGEMNSNLLGMIFVMKFQAAAMSRANIPEDDRKDFCLYVDEFQNFSTDSFASIMSEARKYRLNLVVANQFTTQLTEEIRDAVFGNIGTIVSYRIGQVDLEAMSRYFQPMFDGDDLLRIPNYNSVVRTLIRGVPTQPFSMAGVPPLGKPNPELGTALKQLSAAKNGRPRQVVEKEIFERMKTNEPPAPPYGSAPVGQNKGFGANSPYKQAPATAAGAAARPAAAAMPPAGGGSFLDQWLEKRRKAQAVGGQAAPGPISPPSASSPSAAAPTPVAAAPQPQLQQQPQQSFPQQQQPSSAPQVPQQQNANPIDSSMNNQSQVAQFGSQQYTPPNLVSNPSPIAEEPKASEEFKKADELNIKDNNDSEGTLHIRR